MSTLIDPRKTFGEAVTELAEHDDRIVVLSADSGGSSGFGMFRKLYPDRYFEFGIQEHGVTGVAAGLATTGRGGAVRGRGWRPALESVGECRQYA